MEFYAFHLMPWPHVPEDFADNLDKYPSAWVTLSNECYDPAEGQHLYNRYLDQLEYAETLGFDGVCVNEHHQNTYGTMPAPNIMGAMLARRTSRLKIAIVGNGLPLRDHPLRVAEEVAMLDVVTGGRVISGFVRGIGCEYFSMGINPSYSMERFREAHDLILKAWTDPGPFSWQGKHFEVRYVNVWPRPLQKPYPRIWIPGFGSSETIEWCAHPDRKYTYLAVYMPENLVKMYFDMYRECAEKFGYTSSPYQLGHMYPVYVADTDAKAEQEAAEHLLWLYHFGLRQKPEFLFPPGYVSHASMMNILSHADQLDWSKMSFHELNEKGFCIVGGVDTVRQRLEHAAKHLGFGVMPLLLHFGNMPHDKTMKNMEMFATEIMPHLRGIHGQPEGQQPTLAAAD